MDRVGSVLCVCIFLTLIDLKQGLAPPSYVSDWRQLDTGLINLREHVFEHGLNELPVKVEVQVHPNGGENEGYYFPGMGSAQTSTNVYDDIGGVVYFYNETKVVVKCPRDNMKVIFTGHDWSNSNDQQRQDGLVRVRAWRQTDFPDPLFSSPWLPMSVLDASMTNLTVDVTNATLPSNLKTKYVSVRVRLLDGPLQGQVCDGQGTSMAYISDFWGGLVYRVNYGYVKVWAPAFTLNHPLSYGSLCNMAGGWGNADSGYGLNGEVQVEIYSLSRASLNTKATASYDSIEEGNTFSYDHSDINTDSDIVDPKVCDSGSWWNNLCNRFWGPMGGVLYPSGSGSSFGGVVFAYSSSSFRMWVPEHNQAFYVDSSWGELTSEIVVTTAVMNVFVYKVTTCRLLVYYGLTPSYVTHIYGTTVTPSPCPDGLTLVGADPVLTCGHYGWNGTAGTCQYPQCNNLTDIENGQLTYDCEHLYVDCNGTYTCDVGYTVNVTGNINLTLRCLESLNWTGSSPSCIIVDCGPLNIPDAINEGNMTTYNSTVTTNCREGYTQSAGDSSRTCIEDGTWSGNDVTCDIVDCGLPIFPSGGVVSVTSTTYTSVAAYSCNAGFVLDGSDSRVCGADGLWNGTQPSCLVIDCGLPTFPSDGAVSVTSTTYTSVAAYSCNAGFVLDGSDSRVCGADGLWNGTQPSCLVIDCGLPTFPSDGAVSVTLTTYTSVAAYSCNAGFVLDGSDSRVCGADGLWNGTQPSCLVLDCGLPTFPSNGAVSVTSTTYTNVATYSCNAGFVLDGNDSRVCGADGLWNGTQPSCLVIDCGSLNSPTNGTVEFLSTSYESVAIYNCSVGFTMSGTGSRVCGAGAQWSGLAPSCHAIDCGVISQPVNGTVVTTDGFALNSVASYACADGLVITGSDNRTCLNTGFWSGTEPTCEPEVCYCYTGDVSNPSIIYTENELTVVIKELVAELTVDKTLTSKSIRAKTSAQDNRSSSKMIGFSGILFITIVGGLVITFDIISVCRHFRRTGVK